MTFNPADFLAQHASPEAALNALNAQLQEAQEGRDREGRAAQAARRERDAARSELDTAREELRTAQQNAAPEGAVVLTGEDATAWQSITERGGLTAWDADRAAAETGRAAQRALDLQAAATALGKPAEALADYLEGKQWGSRTETRDGQTVTVYGVGEGDAFKPLSDLPGVQAIQGSAPEPAPRPQFPRQETSGNKPAPTDPVDALNARMFGQRKEKTA